MRITTWNVNGLRAAIRKGFADQIEKINPDVLLLQEIRVRPEQLSADWAAPAGWHVTWHPAEKPGYAGTAVWTRRPHRVIARGLHDEESCEQGRLLHVEVGKVEVASVYLPSGSASAESQQRKEAWMSRFKVWADSAISRTAPLLIGGDLNIAHTERDIFYAKSNQKQSGFMPHEREWFSLLLNSGWQDLVRTFAGDIDGPYSWWSNRGQARAKDRGWRIDYLLANPPAAMLFSKAHTHREGGLVVSDHAPVSIDLEM